MSVRDDLFVFIQDKGKRSTGELAQWAFYHKCSTTTRRARELRDDNKINIRIMTDAEIEHYRPRHGRYIYEVKTPLLKQITMNF